MSAHDPPDVDIGRLCELMQRLLMAYQRACANGDTQSAETIAGMYDRARERWRQLGGGDEGPTQ